LAIVALVLVSIVTAVMVREIARELRAIEAEELARPAPRRVIVVAGPPPTTITIGPVTSIAGPSRTTPPIGPEIRPPGPCFTTWGRDER
jgi:hypothetical protein